MEHEQLAKELLAAERHRTPYPLFSQRFGSSFSWNDARRIAVAVDELRRSDGDQVAGYKLGWTSAAMRTALGIERPNWESLWISQRIEDVLNLEELIVAKVEPELVCRLGADLDPAASLAEVAGSCTQWTVGLEIVAPRFGSFVFEWLDNTADNSSAARFVIAGFANCDDPSEIAVTMSDRTETRTGRGSAAMGSPVDAVYWLVKALAEEGRQLHAGQIVFTGGLTAPFDLTPSLVVSATAPGVGATCSFRCD
ncbi:MAG: hypothetical protein HKN03_04980 [Acidimicrobiales bacterium]|nr:hypothetical protein [Acidimicrobiales bacterium]